MKPSADGRPANEAASAPPASPGRVVTFYSYKGGVGRSMALANVAALLAHWGRRVLVIDWDLEAPGIEKYFEPEPPESGPRPMEAARRTTRGLVDLIGAFAAGKPIAWASCLIKARPFANGADIAIMTAGQDDDGYSDRVRKLNWERLFDENDLGDYLEQLRAEWTRQFDFVLIDSRTGMTDIGGICTIHLPDILVGLFTANKQSVAGIKRVMNEARLKQQALPVERFRLSLVPVPARDESVTEHERARAWRAVFATELAEFYASWLPKDMTPRDALERLKLPYKAYWSFGERLPAVVEGTTDPASLGYAYNVLAGLLDRNLKWENAEDAAARADVARSEAMGAAVAAAQSEARAKKTYRAAGAIVGVVVLLLAVAGLVFRYRHRADEAARIADEAARRTVRAQSLVAFATASGDPLEGALLLAEAAAYQPAGEAIPANVAELVARPMPRVVLPVRGGAQAALSPSGKDVAVATTIGIRTLPADGSKRPRLLYGGVANAAADIQFSPGGDALAVWERDKITVLSFPDGRVLASIPASDTAGSRCVGDGVLMQVGLDAHLRAWRFDGTPLAVPRVTVANVGRDCTTFVSQRDTKDREIQYAGHILIQDGGLDFDSASRQELRPCANRQTRTKWVTRRFVARICNFGDAEVLPLDAPAGTTPRTLATVGIGRVMVFSREGDRLLLVDGFTGMAMFWNLATGASQQLANTAVQDADLDSPGDTALLVTGDDAQIWRRPFTISRPGTWGDLARTVRAATPACLAPPQRRSYLGEDQAAARAAYDECARTHGIAALSDGELPVAASSTAKAAAVAAQLPILQADGAPPAGAGDDTGTIAKVVHSRQRELSACYQRALARNPQAGGRIVMTWTITKSGGVKDLSPAGGLADPTLAACLEKVIAQFRFPIPAGGEKKISLPLTFTASSAASMTSGL